MLESRAKWKFNENEYTKDHPTHSGIINSLLSNRGITTSEQAKMFISPSLDHLHSPSKLAMIVQASERIKEAILNKEKILIYGDYDADGVCSTTLLLKALNEIGAKCDFYIPNRFKEGYGLNKEAFQFAYNNDFKVIITVDTGIAAHKEVDFANQLGLDVIITDHHDIQEEVPNAYAILHPDYSPNYQFKQLAGVGVAFKLAEYLLGYFPEHLLDLVAIGTIADLVPLVDENRILAKYGLQTLSQTNNKGLIALKKACSIEDPVTEEDVGFRIGPRLNSVGRLQDADLAVHLLMTENNEEAQTFVQEIEALNNKRQQIVRDIVKEAEAEISETPGKNVIIVAKPNWHEGVLGIVASRLVQKYHRPAIVLRLDETTNELKGSARSIPAFHLFNHCMKIRDLFTSFGGHSQAAGMAFPLENKAKITHHLNGMVQKLSDEDLKETIEINKTLSAHELTEQLVDEVNQLAPFGIDNPKPIFHLKEIPNQLQQIGRLKDHLKIQYDVEDQRVEGIGFGMGNFYTQISPQVPVEIIGELGINEWNGFRTVQMVIRDMKIDEWQLFDHRGKKDFDIRPYIDPSKPCLILDNEEINKTKEYIENVSYVSFESDFSKLGHTNQLFIKEFPANLNALEQVVKITQPKQIYVCFYIRESAYLQAFPSREEFKWLYALILRERKFDVRQKIPFIMNTKGWSKDKVIFMFQVFIELAFIQSEKGIITPNPEPAKRDLSESQAYKDRLQQADIEKALYYSNYTQLKDLFSQWIGSHTREEVSYGL